MKPSERYKIEQIKQQYPPGTRLELKEMDDPHAPVQPGTRGTVAAVDDMGTIHMKWDNGRTLGVVPGVDLFRKLTAQEIQAEQEIKITQTTSIRSSLSSSTATASAYTDSVSLKEDKTYTVSAYVNTSGATFASGTGIYFEVKNSDGTSTYFTGDPLTYKTSGTIEGGWTRISMTFTAEVDGYHRIVLVNNGVTGNVYIDDVQLEEGEAASNINLLTDGTMESTSGWSLETRNIQYYGSGSGSGEVLAGQKSVGIKSTPLVEGYMCQTVPINLPHTQTYVLSGWAFADALPANQPLYPANKRFCLKAEVYYVEAADPECDEFFLPFSPEIDNEWQFVSMVICPRQELTVKEIVVYCAYHNNVGTAYFDNISLTREPAQTMKYNDDGYLVSVATADISEDVNTYSGGNLIKTVTSGSGTFDYTYDNKHNLLTASNEVITQTNTYNTMGNVITTTLSGSDTDETITSYASYTYDGNRLQDYTDMLGGTYSNTYTYYKNKMYGLPSSTSNPDSVTTDYFYLNDGKTDYQYLKDSDGNELVRLIYNYYQNNLRRVTRTGGAVNQIYSLTYNDFSQVTSVKVGNWALSNNTYDSAGALTNQTFGNADYVNYEYDELGRVKTTTTEMGKNVVYAYNSDGQLASKTMNPSSTKLRYDYLYDSLGRLIRSSRHDNGTLKLETRHEYDDSNRLSKQYINLVDRAESVAYTYNDKGLLTKLDHTVSDLPNISDLTYGYDELQRLSIRTNPKMVQTYTYQTGTSLVSNISYDPGTGDTLFTAFDLTYVYDNLGNIKSITSTSTNVVENASFVYDKQGQLTNATIGGVEYEYTYDTAGNILTFQDEDGVVHEYGYEDSTWADILKTYDGETIRYDGSGNPVSYYNGTRWTFGWQNGRELTTASKTGTSISYTYDGDGIRTSKTVGDVTYNYVYASGKLMRQTWTENGTTKVIDFVYDDKGAPYAFRYNNRYYYYVLNLQGDVVKIVTETGDSYGVYRYDAWGNITYSTNNDVMNSNPLRYRGYVYDTETGFYYLQSRYYDPAIGRFINADSFASTGQDFIGYNMFAYCGNDPVSRRDDSGELFGSAILVAATVGAAFSAVADMAVQLVTTGTVDFGQSLIAAAAGAASGACALIPGTKAVTTLASGAINAALGVGAYSLNQFRKGEKLEADGMISNAISGFIGGIAGNLFRYNSTGAMRDVADHLLDKGMRKIAANVASTVKRGGQYMLRGINAFMDYAEQAGVNSGVGSVVAAITNPFINDRVKTI